MKDESERQSQKRISVRSKLQIGYPYNLHIIF